MRNPKNLVLAAIAFAVVAALPAAAHAAASTPKLTGVVVAREQARGTIVLATAHGAVRTIRTHARARVGARLVVRATRLSDGTYRSTSVRTRGTARRAAVHGVVVTSARGRLVLSAGGSVFSVRRGRVLAARSSDPQTGDVVDASVSFSGGDVEETNLQQVGQTGLLSLEGTISSLSAGTLVLAVDQGALTTIVVPSSLTLPSTIAVGDQVEVLAQFANGTFTLAAIQDDHAAASSGSGTNLSDGEHGKVESEGIVAAVSPTSLSVQPEHGSPVVFTVPSGFDLTGVQVGVRVHAKGVVQPDGSLLLARLEVQGGEGEQHGDVNTVKAEGTVSSVDASSLVVQGEHGDTVTFTVPAGFDLTGVAVGDVVEAKGTKNADGTTTLVSVERQDSGSGGSGDSGSGSGDSGSGGSGSGSGDSGSGGSSSGGDG